MSEQIIEYRVEIYKHDSKRNVYRKDFHHVALENDLYIILDNLSFTRLSKKNDGTDVVGKEMIYERNLGIKSFDGITYVQYTYKNVMGETIQRHIRQFIEKKYGWLGGINLDFIL